MEEIPLDINVVIMGCREFFNHVAMPLRKEHTLWGHKLAVLPSPRARSAVALRKKSTQRSSLVQSSTLTPQSVQDESLPLQTQVRSQIPRYGSSATTDIASYPNLDGGPTVSLASVDCR